MWMTCSHILSLGDEPSCADPVCMDGATGCVDHYGGSCPSPGCVQSQWVLPPNWGDAGAGVLAAGFMFTGQSFRVHCNLELVSDKDGLMPVLEFFDMKAGVINQIQICSAVGPHKQSVESTLLLN